MIGNVLKWTFLLKLLFKIKPYAYPIVVSSFSILAVHLIHSEILSFSIDTQNTWIIKYLYFIRWAIFLFIILFFYLKVKIIKKESISIDREAEEEIGTDDKCKVILKKEKLLSRGDQLIKKTTD